MPPEGELEDLDLSGNQLDTLDPGIADLVKLKLLDLHCNAFHGTVPACVGELVSLEKLDVDGNNFSSLDPSMRQLRKLRTLDLHCNAFYGPVPAFMGELTALEDLDLYNNKFTSLDPALCNLVNLDNIVLFGNPWQPALPENGEGEVDPDVDEAPNSFLCRCIEAQHGAAAASPGLGETRPLLRFNTPAPAHSFLLLPFCSHLFDCVSVSDFYRMVMSWTAQCSPVR